MQMLKVGRLVGIDLSDTLLDQARERLKGRKSCEILKGNAGKTAFSNHSFDRIVCSEVLEHVQHPPGSLTRFSAWPKPHARIVISVPNEDLINLAKNSSSRLGLKKFVAGDYPMSII